MEEKYIELITETSERAKSNTHQIDEMKEDIKGIKEDNKVLNRLATSVELIAQDMTHFKNDISEMKGVQSDTQASQAMIRNELSEMRAEMKTEISDVRNERLISKAKTYEEIKSKVMAIIVTGIAAFILGTIAPAIFGK